MSRPNSIANNENLQAEVTLQDLAASRRWVAYSGAPKADGTIDKAPLNPKTGGNAQNNNPATWGTRKAAEARAKSLMAPGHKPGVGIELGELGDGKALCGVDLDGCHKSGLESWAEAIWQRFRTNSEVSPSGEGVKLFFLVRAEDLPAIRNAMGTERKKEWKLSRHYGAELHLTHSYFTVTGLAYGEHGDALRLVPLADLLWLVNEAGPIFLKAKGAMDRGSDESGSGYGYRLLLDLFRAGSTEDEAIIDVEYDLGPAGEWWNRTDDRQRDRAVMRARAEIVAERKTDLVEITADFDFVWRLQHPNGKEPQVGSESRGLTPAADLDDWGAPMMQGDKPINNQHNAILYLSRKPFAVAGFGNWFRDRVVEAKLPDGLSAHGIRKAACRRFAELGCSAPQIMAYSGHKNLKEVQTYIEAANRLGLARQALQMQVTADENRTRIVKPSGEV